MEVAILAVIFGSLFGIFYLYFSTRNKERLALIEKGADASIFISTKNQKTAPIWKVLILNISLLLMGIGLGIFIGLILDTYTNLGQPVYPATVFFTAGLCLFAGFHLTKSLDKE
ncbi:hypothetical protein LPB03_05945 [Polaribacter vadi]|jgi:sterol desaturase/sphingolipid hydroxylase (fatty acid hydroxylase superfamily)|uniref:DUF6249 domain-containing protein n=1 Tax=Polaribacter vadi TaxID=1774273 RepID=A0A1B8TWF2_9FLAO|nr:hypothetical protein LPB03_05945 [Polaribacter vadi]OBY64056.1 hypothetical protein LPB3_06545 [Polaribacter vadi]|tara:strand:+ start:114 stop:455 length:342 start_codon:yes stop_codon:yes gene_type:complete